MSNIINEKVVQNFIVPGGFGHAFHVKKNQTLTIKDLEGQQVVDFIAFKEGNYDEYISVSQIRTSPEQRLNLQIGDKLITNLRNPIAKIVEDTVKVHDILIAACEPAYYKEIGLHNHRSCHENFIEVLKPYGITPNQRPDPINFFQNTKIKENGTYFDDIPVSKPNDYIKMLFLEDALCAVSACPFDIDGFNDGKATSIEVKVE